MKTTHICDSGLTGHADAAVGPALVQAGAVVLTGVRVALVDVLLAAPPREAPHAVALERPVQVLAGAPVFTHHCRRTCCHGQST